jgi:hypothetical protein
VRVLFTKGMIAADFLANSSESGFAGTRPPAPTRFRSRPTTPCVAVSAAHSPAPASTSHQPLRPTVLRPAPLDLPRVPCSLGGRSDAGQDRRHGGSSMARAIPDQPSRAATSISIVHRVHRRPARVCCRRDECSTRKVAYGEDHSDPTEYIPGSSKRPARIPLTSPQSDRRSPPAELRHDRHHAGHRTAATEDVATLLDSARPSMAATIPDPPSRIPGPVPRLARTRPGRTSRWIGVRGVERPVPGGSARKSAAIIPFVKLSPAGFLLARPRKG